MAGGNGTERTLSEQKAWLWEVFARTGFPCALRALRDLERRESEASASTEASAA